MSLQSFENNAWESYAIDCDPSELKNRIEDAETSDNQDMIEGRDRYFPYFFGYFYPNAIWGNDSFFAAGPPNANCIF